MFREYPDTESLCRPWPHGRRVDNWEGSCVEELTERQREILNFIVKETELPELVIVVKPTAHWLFWRVDADPMPLVFNVTPSLA